MKAFVSWSGPRSRAIATALKTWIPDVCQQVDVWMSEHDVGAGSRWGQELASVLGECHFGIICLTPENQDAPWLLFEAGCLAKTVNLARVVPYLHELSPTDVRYPLAQFQGVSASKPGTLKLLHSLNEAGQLGIPGDRLERLFEKWWPDLEKTLAKVGAVSAEQHPARSERELLEEILGLLRKSSGPRAVPALSFDSAQITIDTNSFFEAGGRIALPYDPNRSVSDFLDAVYFALNEIGRVPPYEYGTVWLLQDQVSGLRYDDIGIEYCRTQGHVKDNRSIASVGVKEGDRLLVIHATDSQANKALQPTARKARRG